MLSVLCRPQYHGSILQRKHPKNLAEMEWGMEKWLSTEKIRNIAATAEDRTNITISSV